MVVVVTGAVVGVGAAVVGETAAVLDSRADEPVEDEAVAVGDAVTPSSTVAVSSAVGVIAAPSRATVGTAGGSVSSTTAALGTKAAEAAASVGAESKIEVLTRAAAEPAPRTATRDKAVAVAVFMGAPRLIDGLRSGVGRLVVTVGSGRPRGAQQKSKKRQRLRREPEDPAAGAMLRGSGRLQAVGGGRSPGLSSSSSRRAVSGKPSHTISPAGSEADARSTMTVA